MHYWTIILSAKAFIAFLFAGASLWYNDHLGQPYHWTVPATYMMTGIIIVLIGLLVDTHYKNQVPQKVRVLLKHEGQAWYLIVMRTPNGELYAPADPELRRFIPAFLKTRGESDNVLGCPRFTPIQQGDKPAFKILGEIYLPHPQPFIGLPA